MIPSFLASAEATGETQKVVTQAAGDPTLTLFGGLVLLILVFWYFASDRDKVRRNIGLVVMIATVIFSILAIAPISGWMDAISGKKKFSEVHNLKRGIDIAGGVSFVLEVQPAEGQDNVSATALNQVKNVLLKRLITLGYGEPVIILQPEHNRVEVQIPDADEQQAALVREKLTQVAVMDIFKVNEQKSAPLNKGNITYYDESRPEGQRWNIQAMEDLLVGERLFPVRRYDEKTGEEFISKYIITTSRTPGLSGDDVKYAFADNRTGTQIIIELTRDGGKKNLKFTGDDVGRGGIIAIVFDGICISTPQQNADELGSDFVINGMKDLTECKRLAANMNNPLKNKPEIKSERQVSATLGASTISQGIKAGLYGLGLTLVFVVLYYRWAGIIALIGLSVNILIIFGSMALMSATFTLPGIAGVILTIGVAVDANVLIYERLREERQLGKSFADSLRIAYEKAFSAIIDANITTLITALILFAMASGAIKGFAVTLTIGIMGTLLAALIFTRVLFWIGADFGVIKEAKFLDLIPKKSIDFLRKGRMTLTISALLIAASLVIGFMKGNDALGVDFTGGTNIEYQVPNSVFEKNTSLDQPSIQAKLDALKLSQSAKSQIASPQGDDYKYISIKLSGDRAEIEQVDSLFRGMAPELSEKVDKDGKQIFAIKANEAGISASMGTEFLTNSLIALGLGLVGILIYITLRFEFSFAVGAFCALFHDVIVVVGLLLIKGDEITMIHVGAFLTIAGYSINDTIVVFDRIRENLKYSEASVGTVMNQAISATLSRTILTSVTTFVAVLVLYLFGGTALSDFSFTIMAGVVVGTYSSVFVASPIVWLFSKARGKDLREEVITAEKHGEELEELETEVGGDEDEDETELKPA